MIHPIPKYKNFNFNFSISKYVEALTTSQKFEALEYISLNVVHLAQWGQTFFPFSHTKSLAQLAAQV